MKNRHTYTTTPLLLLAALCLCAGAAAQEQRGRSKEFEPTAAQEAEAGRMRGALAEAVGEGFEVERHRLTRRSNWYGGQLYWLAYMRAKRPGGYGVKYKYRYMDRANPRDPLYTFVEHKTFVGVGPEGCARRPRSNLVCVGDTFILPVLVGEHSGHAFSAEPRPFSPEDPSAAKSLRRSDESGLHREPVPNPAAPFLKYLGSRAHVAPHRIPGYTVRHSAVFEAVGPGAFNLRLRPNIPGAAPPAGGERSDAGVPVVVLDPKAPATVLASGDDVHGYSERFSSTGGGTSFLTTPVILQPGELLTIHYHTYSRRGRGAEFESGEALKAGVKDRLPVITLLPFQVDPAQDFNEWVLQFLPPARRE